MTHPNERHDHDPIPFLAYTFYALVLICLLAGAGIMWGITQDQNWHGFGGVVGPVVAGLR